MKTSTTLLVATTAVAFIGAALTGCATRPAAEMEPSALAALTLPELSAATRAAAKTPAGQQDRPVVALVLGGGGLRGFAHVGVLQALEEAGIRPDLLVGTSVGSVVGAAYASGLTAAQVEQAARSVVPSSLIDFTLSTSGLMRGEHIARWVGGITGHAPIEHFPIRFAAVATDLQSGRPVAITTGPAGPAVQASAAVPGVTVPVPYRGGHLVDGGSASLVPVRLARAMGASTVIAVNIYCNEEAPADRTGSTGALAVMHRVMRGQSCQGAQAEMAEADVVVAPRLVAPGLSDSQSHERAIRAGYEAASAALATGKQVARAGR
jgi:NTE family protein